MPETIAPDMQCVGRLTSGLWKDVRTIFSYCRIIFFLYNSFLCEMKDTFTSLFFIFFSCLFIHLFFEGKRKQN